MHFLDLLAEQKIAEAERDGLLNAFRRLFKPWNLNG